MHIKENKMVKILIWMLHPLLCLSIGHYILEGTLLFLSSRPDLGKMKMMWLYMIMVDISNGCVSCVISMKVFELKTIT